MSRRRNGPGRRRGRSRPRRVPQRRQRLPHRVIRPLSPPKFRSSKPRRKKSSWSKARSPASSCPVVAEWSVAGSLKTIWMTRRRRILSTSSIPMPRCSWAGLFRLCFPTRNSKPGPIPASTMSRRPRNISMPPPKSPSTGATVISTSPKFCASPRITSSPSKSPPLSTVTRCPRPSPGAVDSATRPFTRLRSSWASSTSRMASSPSCNTKNSAFPETRARYSCSPAPWSFSASRTSSSPPHFFPTAPIFPSGIGPATYQGSDPEAEMAAGTPTPVPLRMRVYVGPKDLALLSKQKPSLEELINFGWTGIIAKPCSSFCNGCTNTFRTGAGPSSFSLWPSPWLLLPDSHVDFRAR